MIDKLTELENKLATLEHDFNVHKLEAMTDRAQRNDLLKLLTLVLNKHGIDPDKEIAKPDNFVGVLGYQRV